MLARFLQPATCFVLTFVVTACFNVYQPKYSLVDAKAVVELSDPDRAYEAIVQVLVDRGFSTLKRTRPLEEFMSTMNLRALTPFA